MADAEGSSYITVSFSPPPSFTLNFDEMRGTEELGQPFFFELKMTSGKILVADLSSMIGTSASVKLVQSKTDDTPRDERYISGIVTRVVSEGLVRGAYHYRIELRPWLWLLSRVADCKIFQNKSPFDIVTGVFRDAGFSDFRDNRQSSSGSTALEYCVQYRETTFDFVMRLMEEFGFYYYFEHTSDKHTLVFADDPNSHTELPDKVPYLFDQTEYRTVQDHIWEWSGDFALSSGKYTARDYNFTTPSADLTAVTLQPASHPYGSYEVYEYPGLYGDTSLGTTLADIRMQAIAKERAVFLGASNSRKLHAGWKFGIERVLDSAANRAYLITRSEITTTIAEGMSSGKDSGETIDTYRVLLRAIPDDVHFRLPRRTRRPTIRGPQTAKVMGAAGDEITTDQYGRIKVKFYWDRSTPEDDTCTCWIRVAQTWAGLNWGAIVIPRVGMEVVVEFLEGNPDRPLVTGVVYNATETVPYALPDNKTRSTFKTNSSTGGDGFNELRFEDKAGSEEIYIHAQKDYNREVLNNETITVTQDSTTTVKQGNRSVTVSQGNDSHTVSTGNRSVTVSTGNDSHTVSQGNRSATVSLGNDSLTVSTGNHSITVSVGSSSVTAMQSITLTCGPSSITISPDSIAISAPMISISAEATMTVDGGGELSLSGGMVMIN